MTETTPTAAEPARSADPSRQSPGEYLRRLREEKGHTHATVGSALHLTAHYIKALESDEYGKLPGLTFVKGYLRSYARFLGADVDSVIGRFDEHIAGLLDAGMHTARVQRSKRRQDQALRWAIGAGFVVVASLAAGWWFMSGGNDAPEAPQGNSPAVAQTSAVRTPPPVTAAASAARSSTPAGITPPQTITTSTVVPQNMAGQTTVQALPTQGNTGMTGTLAAPPALNPAPVVTAPVPATGQGTPLTTSLPGGARNVSLIASGDDELRVVFNGNSWIEVDDGRMVRLYNDMLRTGDTLTIRGFAPFHVLLGDASKVQMSLNAAALDISADVRDDRTARLVLGAPVPAADAVRDATPAAGEAAPAVEQAPAATEGAQQ